MKQHPLPDRNRFILEYIAEAQGLNADALIQYRRLERRRVRAQQRRQYGSRFSLHQAIRNGYCAGVPEIGHAPHQPVERGYMTRDHIIPRCFSGTSGLSNLRPVCIWSHRELNKYLDRHLKAGLGVIEWMRWQAQYDVMGDFWIR